MSISTIFHDFCNSIKMVEDEVWQRRIAEITKKINKKYYDTNNDHDHRLLVGSVGRHTATNNVSDYDVLYILPWNVYHRFDKHSENGQSDFLQEVKECIKERYPKTQIKADGQVIDVTFSNGLIEIVPGFENDDGSFQYADTNDGGKWRTTNPRPEKQKCIDDDNDTNGTFRDCCRMLRIWKNHNGFVFSGLLIDTLIDKCYVDDTKLLNDKSYKEYPNILKQIFEFLSNQSEDQKYWHALGSNQQIGNHDNNKFIKNARKAFDKLDDIDLDNESDVFDTFSELFGYDFKKLVDDTVSNTTEDFASTYFTSIDIKGSFDIECTVSQNGFRIHNLKYYLSSGHKSIFKNRNLLFKVVHLNLPQDIAAKNLKYYWKIRNYGIEAEKARQLRGQIIKGSETHREKTLYKSMNHYVECYVVDDGIVVARKRIIVPIGEYENER